MTNHSSFSPRDPVCTCLLVKVKKLRPCLNPAYPSADWHDYPFGSAIEGVSLPVDYELIGYLLGLPKVGGRLIILRVSRNGVNVPGLFCSSRIRVISDMRIETTNSVYHVEFMSQPSS